MRVPWRETPSKITDTVTRAEAAGHPFTSLTRRDRFLTHPVVHEAAYALRYVGLRGRLTCPDCAAVGTFKPHGGMIDWLHDLAVGRRDTRTARRWLCKFCGVYLSRTEGRNRAFPDLNPAKKWWVLPATTTGDDPEAVADGPTPRDALIGVFGSVVNDAGRTVPAVNPWMG